MRITKRQLKRIIREEYSMLRRRGLISEAAPMRGGQTILFQVLELAGADEMLPDRNAQKVLARLRREMDPQDFDIAAEISTLLSAMDEHPTGRVFDKIVEELEPLCAQLGLSVDQLLNAKL